MCTLRGWSYAIWYFRDTQISKKSRWLGYYKKTKDELQELRREANTIDSMDNENVAVVSVLML